MELVFFALATLTVFVTVTALEAEEPIWNFLKRLTNIKTPKAFQPHVRSIQKMEKDAQTALEAIKNLHETKKRINAEYRENWDNEFRLLLPPPEAPKGREALKVKAYYRHELYAYKDPVWPSVGTGDYVNTSLNLIPIGFYGKNGSYWYAFNNLPGHQHKIMFIPMTNFEQMGNKFWAFLPELHRRNDEWVWQGSKVKTLATNLKEAAIEITVG